MKKSLVLTALIFVSACTTGPMYHSNTEADYTHYNCTNRHSPCYARKTAVKQAPKPILVYQAPQAAPQRVISPCSAMVAQQAENTQVQVQTVNKPCGSCAPSVQIVTEPVEIVYKKVTTTTTYEPKTTTNITYERKAIVAKPVTTKTVVTTTQTTEPEVIKTEPVEETISYTIDTTPTDTSAPVMPADEIK